MFWLLITLVFVICLLTILFALIDLKVVYNYTGDINQDPLWFRVLLCLCEFGVWDGVYMTTFVVSYTYF